MALSSKEIDATLMRMADSASPEQISAELKGVLSPMRVRARIQELVTSTDWLTNTQQEWFVVQKMREILRRLEGQFQDNDSLQLQLRTLKEIGTRLDKRRDVMDVDLATYSANTGRQLLHVVDVALSYMRGALRDEIDAERWDELFGEALNLAQVEVEKKQQIEA